MSDKVIHQRPYEHLSDSALRAHYDSVTDQGVAIADEIGVRRESCPYAKKIDAALHDITGHISMVSDINFQSLVTAWSTHGGLISAELARRAEARDEETIGRLADHAAQLCKGNRVDEWLEATRKPPSFADMLKEHNNTAAAGLDRLLKDIAEEPDEPPATVDEPGPPEDFSMFTSAELLTAYEALVRDFKACIGEGQLGMARELREEWLPIKAEIVRREDAQ